MAFHSSLHPDHNHLSMSLWAGQQRRRLLLDSITTAFDSVAPPIDMSDPLSPLKARMSVIRPIESTSSTRGDGENNKGKGKKNKSHSDAEIKAARDTFTILADSILGKEKEMKSKKKMEQEIEKMKREQEERIHEMAMNKPPTSSRQKTMKKSRLTAATTTTAAVTERSRSNTPFSRMSRYSSSSLPLITPHTRTYSPVTTMLKAPDPIITKNSHCETLTLNKIYTSDKPNLTVKTNNTKVKDAKKMLKTKEKGMIFETRKKPEVFDEWIKERNELL